MVLEHPPFLREPLRQDDAHEISESESEKNQPWKDHPALAVSHERENDEREAQECQHRRVANAAEHPVLRHQLRRRLDLAHELPPLRRLQERDELRSVAELIDETRLHLGLI